MKEDVVASLEYVIGKMKYQKGEVVALLTEIEQYDICHRIVSVDSLYKRYVIIQDLSREVYDMLKEESGLPQADRKMIKSELIIHILDLTTSVTGEHMIQICNRALRKYKIDRILESL